MFKFTDVKNDVDRLEKAEKMKAAFSPLKSEIEIVQSYEFEINSRKTDYSYDIVIISEYKTWEDLDTYIKHPEHQKAIILCNDITKEKAVVDYEF